MPFSKKVKELLLPGPPTPEPPAPPASPSASPRSPDSVLASPPPSAPWPSAPSSMAESSVGPAPCPSSPAPVSTDSPLFSPVSVSTSGRAALASGKSVRVGAPPGVGSKVTQPTSSKGTSTH